MEQKYHKIVQGDIRMEGDEFLNKNGEWSSIVGVYGAKYSQASLEASEYRRPIFSEEYQTALRIKWANDPDIPLEIWNPIAETWFLNYLKGWDTSLTYREIPPKPKTQEEIDLEAFHNQFEDGSMCPITSAKNAWLAACKYAREETAVAKATGE